MTFAELIAVVEPRSSGSNWFGVSVYHPDRTIELGDTTITMSLQGMAVPYNDEYRALFDAIAVKYIRIEKGGAVLWETWTGEIPPDDVIDMSVC